MVKTIEPELSEEETSSSESESDGEPIVYLNEGREKRSNAGNRMRAMLDEEDKFIPEEEFKEEVGDIEFIGKDEADVFDSDFGSTDEGSEAEDDESGEKKLERETRDAARQARGLKKRKTHTPFLPSFARQTKGALKAASAIASSSKETLDDDGEPIIRRKKKVKVDPNTIIPRESSRKSVVAFKETVQGRLKQDAGRRASIPKRNKRHKRALTQADLISEALSTEEVNRASLLAFYAAEEDRREADRLYGMRYEIIGSKYTFLSRTEGGGRDFKGKGRELEIDYEMTPAERAKIAKDRLESGRRRLIEVIGESGKAGWRASLDVAALAEAGEAERAGKPIASTSRLDEVIVMNGFTNGHEETSKTIDQDSSTTVSPSKSSKPTTLESTTSLESLIPQEPRNPELFFPVEYQPILFIPQDLPNLPPPPPARDDTHTRNYFIIEDWEGTQVEEMKVIFGEHHEWGSVKLLDIPRKEKPLPTCLITGEPAHYRDPFTFAPYSNITAFKTLKKLRNDEFIWNEALEAYTGQIGIGVQKDIESEVEATERELKRIKLAGVARERAERIRMKEEVAFAKMEIDGEAVILPPLPNLLPSSLPEIGSRRKSVNGNGNVKIPVPKGKRVVRVYDEMSDSNSDTPSPKSKTRSRNNNNNHNGRSSRKSISRASKKDDSEFDPRKFGHD